MLPDLTGLSQEEAALITDVLSQLSIGSTAATSTVPQSTPTHAALQDQTLTELDLATWTIEQELRNLSGPRTQGPQQENGQNESYNRRTNPILQGPAATQKAFSHDGFHSAPQARQPPVGPGLLNASFGSASGNWAVPTAADVPLFSASHPDRPSLISVTPQQSGRVETSSQTGAPTSAGGDELASREAQQPQSTDVADPESQVEAVGPNQAGPQSPRPQQQSTSLLKEMREKLRQQQTLQRASDGPPDTGGSTSASVNGSTASVAGLRGPAAGPIGTTVRSDAWSVGGASPGSVTSARTRRAHPFTPGSVAKAFTMLNARTSVERYGPEAGFVDVQSLTPTKQPVKLPEPERSARLQQLYQRTALWRQRCEERYAKERHERATSELEECTFTPKITTASHLIVQGKSPSEAYLELSKGGTPTKHQRTTASPSSGPSAATHTAPATRSSQEGDAPMGSRPGTDAKAVTSVPLESSSGGKAGGVSPPRRAANSSEAGERLYQRALELRARQEARFFRQQLEDERQRRFTALVQNVSPRVFNPPGPPSARYLPSGLEECTFHPSTSASNGRPKSAPHMRGAGGRTPSQTSPLYHIYGPPGMSGSAAALGYDRLASITPDLDWDEFLARQDRFMAKREQKIALLEQSVTATPRICPGSKKLLREREARQSFLAASGGVAETIPETIPEGSPLVQAAPPRTLLSAGRTAADPEERRAKIIMEMYKECTFQPQITRKASALPGRQLEDFVEGGRARREEWRQQQQALKEMREAAELTFKPTLITKDAYPHVRPRICLQEVDAYMAHIAERRKQRDALRAELEMERQARELEQCTFSPQITPLPPFIIRRLQEQHLQQLQACHLAYSVASSGGLGNAGGVDTNLAGMGQDPPTDILHSPQAAPGHDRAALADELVEASQKAYQRALLYATMLKLTAA